MAPADCQVGTYWPITIEQVISILFLPSSVERQFYLTQNLEFGSRVPLNPEKTEKSLSDVVREATALD